VHVFRTWRLFSLFFSSSFSPCLSLSRALPLFIVICCVSVCTELLDYLQVVTKNQSEKVMTKIVDFVSGSPDMHFLER
jgi:hypothetical protein